jgi:hypothetical protein
VRFEVDVTFSIGDLHYPNYTQASPIVPGREKTEVVLEFDVATLDGSLADGRLTFGDARVAQTIVPLGAGAGLVAHEPRQVLGNTAFTFRDLVFEITRCEVRGDIATEHTQAPSGHLDLACSINATYTGPSSFHYFDAWTSTPSRPTDRALTMTCRSR